MTSSTGSTAFRVSSCVGGWRGFTTQPVHSTTTQPKEPTMPQTNAEKRLQSLIERRNRIGQEIAKLEEKAAKDDSYRESRKATGAAIVDALSSAPGYRVFEIKEAIGPMGGHQTKVTGERWAGGIVHRFAIAVYCDDAIQQNVTDPDANVFPRVVSSRPAHMRQGGFWDDRAMDRRPESPSDYDF